MKELSIIIVTYNSAACIQDCLDSVYAQGFKDYEVIVIDNYSRDATAAIIKNRYPEIAFIENADNLGVCRARNLGIARAQGRFIIFIDHDVKLAGNFLENIYRAIKGRENVGAAGPKILTADGSRVYSAGIHRSFLWRFHDIGSGHRDDEGLAKKKDVFGVSAAAIICRREALEAIRQDNEYFDEDFFYFLEDVDLCWRLQKKSWRILYAPEAVCFHRGGRSRNKDGFSQYLSMRNRYFLILKNASLLSLLRLPSVFFIYDLWRNLFMALVNSRYFFQAILDLIRLSPKMLKKRQRR
jgi:GT2 family glycosyltransferase